MDIPTRAFLLTIAALSVFTISCDEQANRSNGNKVPVNKSANMATSPISNVTSPSRTSAGPSNTAPIPVVTGDGPAAVVADLFAAAKSGDLSRLSGMCMPDGSGDGDTKEICGYGKGSADKAGKFKEYFAEGRIVGQPQIEGDTARVAIKFGPGGKDDEEVILKRKNGKWYLYGM